MIELQENQLVIFPKQKSNLLCPAVNSERRGKTKTKKEVCLINGKKLKNMADDLCRSLRTGIHPPSGCERGNHSRCGRITLAAYDNSAGK